MKLRIKYADQVVGTFILLAILILAGALALVGLNQRWFEKNYRFKSEFLSGSGISPGTAINFRGFSVGKIEKIVLTDKNTVDVTFFVYGSYYDRVREFSVLELSVSPIGLGTSLLFHQGRGKGVLPEGAFIPRADSSKGRALVKGGLVDIPVKDDTITRLLANANPLIENANAAIVTLNRTLEDVDDAITGRGSGPVADILSDAGEAVASLKGVMASADAKVPALLGSVDAAVGDVRAMMARVDAVMADVKSFTASLAEPDGLVTRLLGAKGSIPKILDDGGELYDKIVSLMDEVQSTISNVESMSRRLNNEMPGISVLLDEGKATLVKAQDVLEGLKNNPILKGGIPERKDQEALFRSLRDEEF
jgi:phospholipid/cholesterol/gamma-HCH transport system substrate-binding protein